MKALLTYLLLFGAAIYCYSAWQPGSPAPHRYSADNVFFLRRYVSVRTPKGSIGLLPGQEVTLSERGPAARGKVSVTDGRDIVEIARDALTHDIDEAAALQASDAQLQGSLQTNIAQSTQAAERQTEAYQAAMANGINASSALMATQNTVGNYRTRLSDAREWHGSGSYYEGQVAYPAVAAQPGSGAVSAARSAGTSFAHMMTAGSSTALSAGNHFGPPVNPTHTDPAGSSRSFGVLKQ